MSRFKIIIIITIVFVAGGVAGWIAAKSGGKEVIGFYKIHPATADYRFVKPLLAVEWTEEIQFSEFAKLKEQLSKYIAQSKAEKKTDQIGIYYRDLENGHWMGLNEKEKFHPASLYKVPIMLAYFKSKTRMQREAQKLVYAGAPPGNVKIESDLKDSKLQMGQSYTLEELIEKMIVDSDNGAKYLLLQNIEPNYLNETFGDLGITIPQSEEDMVTPQEYSIFFRILYNATFLNARNSELALELLSRATFHEGIISGLPADTLVAHKYGVYPAYENGQITNVELHDCGIVYKTEDPSLLCIMTRGSKSTQDLKNAIQDITRMIYSE